MTLPCLLLQLANPDYLPDIASMRTPATHIVGTHGTANPPGGAPSPQPRRATA